MNYLLIDTDIGNDCDDAGALAVAHRLRMKGDCEIVGITSDTSRLDGPQAIEAINQYYEVRVPIGMTQRRDFLDETAGYGAYSRAIAKEYHVLTREYLSAVSVLRQALAKADRLLTLVCLGPLNNIADLVNSKGCSYSDLSGVDLIALKVEKVIVMGGDFSPPGTYRLDGKIMAAEWNILQDIPSAQTVAALMPVEMVFVPYGVGLFKTGSHLFKADYQSPIRLAYQTHTGGVRESWDPLSVYVSVYPTDSRFVYSPKGRVSIDDQGRTHFKEDALGQHVYLKEIKDEASLIELIDAYIY